MKINSIKILVINSLLVEVGVLVLWFSQFVFHLIIYNGNYSENFNWSMGPINDFYFSYLLLAIWAVGWFLVDFLDIKEGEKEKGMGEIFKTGDLSVKYAFPFVALVWLFYESGNHL